MFHVEQIGGFMRTGLGRGLDSLLKVYDEEVKQENNEKSISKFEIRQGDVQKIDISQCMV